MKFKLIPTAIILLFLLLVLVTNVNAYAGENPADKKLTDTLAEITDRLNKLKQNVNALLESQHKTFGSAPVNEARDKPADPIKSPDSRLLCPFPPPAVIEPPRGGIQLVNESIENLKTKIPVDKNAFNETIIDLLFKGSDIQIDEAIDAFNTAQKHYQDYAHLLTKKQKQEIENDLLGTWKGIQVIEASLIPLNSNLNTPGFRCLLTVFEEKYNLPEGLLWAVMMQETGGRNLGYHYPLGIDGYRRTPFNTVSTAYGPFGILNSTAKDPGYGVNPHDINDRSLIAQINFAAEYLAVFIYDHRRGAGDIQRGLAYYGHKDINRDVIYPGEYYAKTVIGRLNNYPGHTITLP